MIASNSSRSVTSIAILPDVDGSEDIVDVRERRGAASARASFVAVTKF